MALPTLRYWTTFSLLGVFILLGGLFVVYAYTYTNPESLATTPATSTPSVPAAAVVSAEAETPAEVSPEDAWTILYPNTEPMTIGAVTVQASIAQTWPERIKGLSDTPYLPPDVVKLFVFDSLGLHSIWMKDMNYAIDILWLDDVGRIVHIVEGAAPESYPAMFVPDTEARYVIETAEGFVAAHGITKESVVVLPNL